MTLTGAAVLAAIGVVVADIWQLKTGRRQKVSIDVRHAAVRRRALPTDAEHAEAGLRREDVILEVDKQEVSDVGRLDELLSKADDGALLLIRRGDATVFVPLSAPPD